MALDRPVVIRLITYVRVPRDVHRRKITRKAVLARDSWTCQYCGQRKPGLTVDHVIPRSRGGTSAWDNIVASCASCNRRKGNHLPREVEMHPRRREAARPDGLHPDRKPQDPRVWEPYLVMTGASGTGVWRPRLKRFSTAGDGLGRERAARRRPFRRAVEACARQYARGGTAPRPGSPVPGLDSAGRGRTRPRGPAQWSVAAPGAGLAAQHLSVPSSM